MLTRAALSNPKTRAALRAATLNALRDEKETGCTGVRVLKNHRNEPYLVICSRDRKARAWFLPGGRPILRHEVTDMVADVLCQGVADG